MYLVIDVLKIWFIFVIICFKKDDIIMKIYIIFFDIIGVILNVKVEFFLL